MADVESADSSAGPPVSQRADGIGGNAPESEPPDEAPDVVGAANGAVPPLEHPLWRRSAGAAASAAVANARGPSARAPTIVAPAASTGGRLFAPLSAQMLERQRRNALNDRAERESERDKDDDRDAAEAHRARRAKRTRAQRNGNGNGNGGADSDPSDDEEGPSGGAAAEGAGDDASAADDADADEHANADDDELAAASEQDENASDVARAAFGGARAARAVRGGRSGRAKRTCQPCTALSQLSDSEADSLDSAAVARARREAFPVHDVNCVGCALPNRIQMIDDFVRVSSARMSESALYKTAGLIFQRDIREPAQREGVSIPAWGWQDIMMHYTLHIVDPAHQRQEDLRSMSNLRKHLEDNLMRVDAETGEQSLDKDNAKLLLAVIAASEKNIDAQQRDKGAAAAGNSKTKRTNAT